VRVHSLTERCFRVAVLVGRREVSRTQDLVIEASFYEGEVGGVLARY